MQKIGCDSVDLIIAERSRFVERHGAANIIEDCRRMWPIAANGFDWILASQRADSADEAMSLGEMYGEVRAYKVLRHQHVPEIELALGRVGAGARVSMPIRAFNSWISASRASLRSTYQTVCLNSAQLSGLVT